MQEIQDARETETRDSLAARESAGQENKIVASSRQDQLLPNKVLIMLKIQKLVKIRPVAETKIPKIAAAVVVVIVIVIVTVITAVIREYVRMMPPKIRKRKAGPTILEEVARTNPEIPTEANPKQMITTNEQVPILVKALLPNLEILLNLKTKIPTPPIAT